MSSWIFSSFFLLFFSCSILPLHFSLWRLNRIDRLSFLFFLFLFYSLSFFNFFSFKMSGEVDEFYYHPQFLVINPWRHTQQRTVVNRKKLITRVIRQESYAQERIVFYTRTICLSILFTLIQSSVSSLFHSKFFEDRTKSRSSVGMFKLLVTF